MIFSPGRGGPTIEFEPPTRSSELRAVARVALKGLAKQIEEAQDKAKDAATKAHLADCLSSIEDALEAARRSSRLTGERTVTGTGPRGQPAARWH